MVFNSSDRNSKVSYAQLAKGKTIERHASGKVPLKTADQFKIMGKPVLHRDAFAKVTGQAKFAGDIQLPGMLYARILRPPSHDAKRISVDLSEAKKIEGIQIMEEEDLIAVLHPYPDVAENALLKIKANYDIPESGLNENTIFDHLLKVAPEGETSRGKWQFTTG